MRNFTGGNDGASVVRRSANSDGRGVIYGFFVRCDPAKDPIEEATPGPEFRLIRQADASSVGKRCILRQHIAFPPIENLDGNAGAQLDFDNKFSL